RQIEAETRPRAGRAVDRDMAIGLSDETIDLAQPQPAPLADLFRRKERLERAPHDLRLHADTIIRHLHPRVGARRRSMLHRAAGLFYVEISGCDPQVPAARHRVPRVDDEVEDGGLELDQIDVAEPWIRSEGEIESDRLAQ